ncbi:mechanosensitive ion channel family protein [Vulcanococcus limneticus]|uniref:mechanosensitive ion channel family protein n=1 Tax=Vulcanococcus limneticus TaxID=2170428 RepID=UPI000B98CADD|nr:mechanosensitive ion channel domain-containing protein [Vulcanococcus limneticus]MCP9790961.1 mechanosensitive ion channel [Vulcanococcus limneticus MW73D5]MCP9892185.1 mechanosensitive ion channel [Vulcanococcus limneticus Candia 3F8]MCP9895993.1 mechanosensitive ion channel [Vulcanococcus limneticus Candia 3B3]
MIELLQRILGWFGYLQRGPVLLQLLVVLLPLLVGTRLRRPRSRWAALLPLAAIGLGIGALALARQPVGLALFLAELVAGWQALGLLHRLLGRVIEPRALGLLESRLIRPGFLLVAVLALIEQIDNLADLGVIPVGRWFGAEVNLGDLGGALLIVYVLVMGSGPPAAGAAWLVQQGVGLSDGSRRALQLMLRYVVIGLGILWALDHIGFNTTAILAVAGGLSVGLGFGIKEVFSNFISGLWLLFEGSVRPGEVLFIDGDPCEVRSLGLRAAVLWRDRDNAELVIPNQTFFTATTTTYTGSDRLRRSQVTVGASYRHDPKQVMALLEATALATPRVLAEPAPKALLLSYGDSAVEYALRFWIANPMDNVSICSDVHAAVWHAFAEQDIEMPYPQRVIHQA